TEKLFYTDADGATKLRADIGLTMGTEDEHLRKQRLMALTSLITGGAGTSNLINTIAANMARKLHLHTLPIVNFDGFTGSDTIPPYVDNRTLFVANSNSGGTSDTIKLTQQLAGLPAVVERLRGEIERRDPELTASLREKLAQIEALLETDVETWPADVLAFIAERTPWVYVVTNIEASALGNIGRGLDPAL